MTIKVGNAYRGMFGLWPRPSWLGITKIVFRVGCDYTVQFRHLGYRLLPRWLWWTCPRTTEGVDKFVERLVEAEQVERRIFPAATPSPSQSLKELEIKL